MAKILFCEDDAALRKLIRLMMRLSEHEIYIAGDGIEGLEVIERERPDLIFADVSMPRCNGFQLADAVKARPHLAHIPIIFMTGFTQQEKIEEGYRHHAADYVIKPLNPAELLLKIELFVGAARPGRDRG